MTSYAVAMPDWDDWQRDYRFGVLLILPPTSIRQQVDALRAKYDPKSHAICTAHISVSDPLSREMTQDVQDEISSVLSAIEPFELHYDPPRVPTGIAGVFYPIRPSEPIDELKRALHSTSAFGDGMHDRRDIPPHMTIAEFISIEASVKLYETIKDESPVGTFRCEELSYLVPDEAFRFRKVKSFPLGGN